MMLIKWQKNVLINVKILLSSQNHGDYLPNEEIGFLALRKLLMTGHHLFRFFWRITWGEQGNANAMIVDESYWLLN